MKKQPQITEQTKTNLRNAFWSLYTQKSLEKISIKEITDLAGYNRGTFYLYYKDVYDIFAQIEDDLLELVKHVLEDVTADGTLDFSRQMSSIIEMSHTYSPYFSVLVSDRGDPRFVTRFKDMLRPMLDQVLFSSLEKGYTEYEKLYLSEFYISGIIGAMGKWLEDPQISIDNLLKFMLPVILNSTGSTNLPNNTLFTTPQHK